MTASIHKMVMFFAAATSLHTLALAENLTLSAPERAIADAAKQDLPIFIVFHKDVSPAAKAMAGEVKSYPAIQNQEALWTSVRVNDPQERRVAEKFKLTRAPMPAVVAVYPNGAVTGVFPNKVTQSNLDSCIASPKMVECLKLLQDNRLVLICVGKTEDVSVPKGVLAFKADPHFAKRTSILKVSAADPAEDRFLTGMDLNPASIESEVTVFLAPPGAHVGTYDVAVSASELAEGLAAAGKCCNDKNCKHNKKSQTR